jgi:TolB-like protein/Tfp pilus assembly protein PilF
LPLFHELKRRNVLRVAAAYVVVAWLAIQVVETIFPAFGFTDAAIRITTIVFGIGLIPTMIFAWAFELTPEGLKKESEVDRSGSITPNTGKKLDRMIMVVLAVALGYFAFDKFVLDPQREVEQLSGLEEQKTTEVAQARQQGRTDALVESYGEKSIAVLPFVNMSSDVEQEYFSDGISEELLNLLAKIPKLRVISRTSAFYYKGKDIKLAQVAEELNVAHILEGSVRKAGNKVRITAQLIEARSDTHLWSESYDRQLDDIFAIQDEIAATVVAQLKITLLGAAPTIKETNPDAYALFLQGRNLSRQFNQASLEQALVLLQQALEIDPGYAAAWNQLSSVYRGLQRVTVLGVDEGRLLQREVVNKALAIDPEYAPVHAALSFFADAWDNDLPAAARHMQRALKLEPANTEIIGRAAELMNSLGRPDEAIALGEFVVARDPVSSLGHLSLARYYRDAGRLDEAVVSTSTLLSLSPDASLAQYNIGTALLLKGEPQAALEAMQRENTEWRLIGLPMVYHTLGRTEESDAALAKLIELDERGWTYNIAYIQAWRGEDDHAFEWLDKAVQYKDSGLSNIAVNNLFSNIHDDPRWLPFLESIGRSPEQLAAIKFEVALPK